MTLTQLRYVIEVAGSHSMSEASRALFISQPSLSSSIKELEDEVGITIFMRSNRGISLTPEGEEFTGYARQVVEQYQLIESRYIAGERARKKFGVSMQHYAFAVKAFVEMAKRIDTDEYELFVRETKTYDVIEDVAGFRSEIGILYMNDFNRKVISKLLSERALEYHELLRCGIYVYMWKKHPLVEGLSDEELKDKTVSLEEMEKYPCLSFDQGRNNSFYFAEEVMSTYEYKHLIHADDRGTMLNLMVGLNGYTLCSGILCEDLNGSDFCAIRLRSDEMMSIVYITRKGTTLSPLGEIYIEEIRRFRVS